jgi:hypothetical protein
MDLYGLNKDMLVKLITTIQDDRKPQNLGDDDLETTTYNYVKEIFKRRSKCIKEYLISKEIYSKEIIDDIITFKISREMLVFSVRSTKLYFQINPHPYLSFEIFNVKNTLIYSFKGIPGLHHNLENKSPEINYQTYSKYVDFVKLLHKNMILLKISKYLLDIFSKDKLE